MTEMVFVGVDSGGTRTNVEVRIGTPLDNPRTIGSYEVSEALSGALPVADIPMVLRKILSRLEPRVDEVGSRPVYVWVSAAGYSPFTRDAFVDALEDARVSVLGSRVARVGIANDATSVLLGSGADIVVIAGTGSNVLLRSTDGEVRQAGGQEWVACDQGSAFWIGLRALREAYGDFENGWDSVLLQRLYEQYTLSEGDPRSIKAKVRDLAIGDRDMKKEIARFAASVCAAARRGDDKAQDIVKAEAESLADLTAGAMRRTFTRIELNAGVELLEVGALLRNEFYRSSFETQLMMRLLAGADLQARVSLSRAETAIDTTLQLAQELATSPGEHLGMDRAFRPAVLRWD